MIPGALLWSLLSPAHASSCCAAAGAQPVTLASCDAFGVAFGAGGAAATGGWSWDRAWSGIGDDGEGEASVSAAVVGRLTPWLQGGLRVPFTLAMDRTDGHLRMDPGVRLGALWLDLETPADWPGARAPWIALELGVGTEAPSAMNPGATVAQTALRGSLARAAWRTWGSAGGRMPLFDAGGPEGDLSVGADRALGGRLRAGLVLDGQISGGAIPSLSTNVGPVLTITPNASNTLLLSARAGLPLGGLGQNSTSWIYLSIDWLRVLAHTRAMPPMVM